jgi:hypothetical protein
MNITFSLSHTYFQENQDLALFFKKLITFLLRIKCLKILSRNYEATVFIKDTVRHYYQFTR